MIGRCPSLALWCLLFGVVISEATIPDDSSDSNVKRILLHSESDIQSAIANLSAEVRALKTTVQSLQTDIVRLQTTTQSGSTYVRWGKQSCPRNGTEIVYSGYAAGSLFCILALRLTICVLAQIQYGIKIATRNKDSDAVDAGAKIYGTEYELWDTNRAYEMHTQYDRNNLCFGNQLTNNNAPCSVCRTSRASVLMIPGRNTCYNGWHLEYAGYLAAGSFIFNASTEYVCLDANPDTLPSGYANEDGALFFLVEGICGSLECPPYENGRELTCAVCSK